MIAGAAISEKRESKSEYENSQGRKEDAKEDDAHKMEVSDSKHEIKSNEPSNEVAIKVELEAEKRSIEKSKTNGEGAEKKPRKRHPKKRKNPDELLKCIICGRYGLTSEFCASGRFCSQRCVGAYASKCRADNLAAAAAAGEIMEPKKKRKAKKEGKKGRKVSLTGFSNEKVTGKALLNFKV